MADIQVALGTTLGVTFQVDNPSAVGSPINADALPTATVYDSDVANYGMTNATGLTSAFRHTGSVTGAANNGSGLIRITGGTHNLQTGDRVTITGVVGTTEANSTWTVTRIAATTFDLQGSTFTNAYVSGGTWNVTGFYHVSVPFTAGNGFASGKTYPMRVNYNVSSTAKSQLVYVAVY